MEHRYSLRFETGERAGETIAVAGQGFTVGRKPGHALQIVDNSVSGKHAEIVVDERGALLRDLDSTNGTRVGGERVLETRLKHGDRVVFGNVPMVFLDATAATVPASVPALVPVGAPAGEPATPGPADTLQRVSPEVLARSRKRPVAGALGLAVLVAVAGLAWYFFGRPARGGERTARAARPAAENLLGEDYSFEGESDGWKAVEGAPAAFLKSAQAAHSGSAGIQADLTDGAWALHRSREVRADAGRALVGSAELRVDGAAVAQIGVELSPPEGAEAAGPVVAWSKPLSAPGEFASVEVSAIVPPGYETARLLVLGRGPRGGTVAADDTALLSREASSVSAAPPVVEKDWQLTLLGEPPVAGVLSRFGGALLTGVAYAAGPEPEQMAEAGTLAAVAQPGRISLSCGGAKAFGLRAETALVRTGLATIGADGYATHGLDFERGNATSLLLGKGPGLVRVAFATPVSLKCVADGQAGRIEARSLSGGEIGEVVLQLDFTEERRKAGDLAYAARNAEKKGDLGECLKQWADLLNGFPYEEALVAEAEAKRGTLVQQGLSELQAAREEIERARFFRLVDLYRQCKAKALAVGARFAGSEVDAEAQKVAAEVDQDLVGLEAELAKVERGRLESILAALKARNAEGLAAEVRAHLDRMPQDSKP